MTSADNKAARFGHEAHEAAIEAWAESLFKACGTASETINVAVDGAALMRARPATAPRDLVAWARDLVELIGANPAMRWCADTLDIIHDLAKAEPVASVARDGFWAQFYADCCEAMGLDQDLPDAARKGFKPEMIADLKQQLEAANDHLDMATAENARVRMAHGELEERAEKAEASRDATAPSELVVAAEDFIHEAGCEGDDKDRARRRLEHAITAEKGREPEGIEEMLDRLPEGHQAKREYEAIYEVMDKSRERAEEAEASGDAKLKQLLKWLYAESQSFRSSPEKVRHLGPVIEEANRLLAEPAPEGEPSHGAIINNRKKHGDSFAFLKDEPDLYEAEPSHEPDDGPLTRWVQEYDDGDVDGFWGGHHDAIAELCRRALIKPHPRSTD